MISVFYVELPDNRESHEITEKLGGLALADTRTIRILFKGEWTPVLAVTTAHPVNRNNLLGLGFQQIESNEYPIYQPRTE